MLDTRDMKTQMKTCKKNKIRSEVKTKAAVKTETKTKLAMEHFFAPGEQPEFKLKVGLQVHSDFCATQKQREKQKSKLKKLKLKRQQPNKQSKAEQSKQNKNKISARLISPLLSTTLFKKWINAALKVHGIAMVGNGGSKKNAARSSRMERAAKTLEITVRIVDKEESAVLNSHYRRKDSPTNILSFPFYSAEQAYALTMLERGCERGRGQASEQELLLGDLVICAPILEEEALMQSKTCRAHLAHLVVHGALHLLGYTHDTEHMATIMEMMEMNILNKLGELEVH